MTGPNRPAEPARRAILTAAGTLGATAMVATIGSSAWSAPAVRAALGVPDATASAPVGSVTYWFEGERESKPQSGLCATVPNVIVISNGDLTSAITRIRVDDESLVLGDPEVDGVPIRGGAISQSWSNTEGDGRSIELPGLAAGSVMRVPAWFATILQDGESAEPGDTVSRLIQITIEHATGSPTIAAVPLRYELRSSPNQVTAELNLTRGPQITGALGTGGIVCTYTSYVEIANLGRTTAIAPISLHYYDDDPGVHDFLERDVVDRPRATVNGSTPTVQLLAGGEPYILRDLEPGDVYRIPIQDRAADRPRTETGRMVLRNGRDRSPTRTAMSFVWSIEPD